MTSSMSLSVSNSIIPKSGLQIQNCVSFLTSPLVRKENPPPLIVAEKSCSTQSFKGIEGFKDDGNLNKLLLKQNESDDYHKNLSKKYINQDRARKILYDFERLILDNDPTYAHLTELEKHYRAMNSHSTTKCLRVKHRSSSRVGVRVDRKHNKAHYSGLDVCGSPWACPVCASKLQNRRAIEIQDAFKWAYKDKQFQMMMVTLTFPHGIADDLGDMLDKLKLAMKYFRKGKTYDKFKAGIKYQGMIKAMEITWGNINGWHPHTHELQIIDYNITPAEEKRIHKFILNRWEMACKKAGLLKHGSIADFRKRAVNTIFHAKDSDYLAKLNNEDRAWGADREMASSSTKQGRLTGLSPFQILEQSDGNEQFQNLFLEYALKMKGKKQLIWSRGLKDKVGIKEKSDKELVNEQTSESELVAFFTDHQWKIVLKNNDRSYIQWLAVNVGFDGLADYFKQYDSVLYNSDTFDDVS